MKPDKEEAIEIYSRRTENNSVQVSSEHHEESIDKNEEDSIDAKLQNGDNKKKISTFKSPSKEVNYVDDEDYDNEIKESDKNEKLKVKWLAPPQDDDLEFLHRL